MREIKYRQPIFKSHYKKDPIFIKFHYWGQHNINGDSWIGPLNVGKNSYQFTGLKDKNGKDIYEGDIINPVIMNGSITEGVVKFGLGRFCVEQIGAERWETSLCHVHNFEIIGNIYENPELLK